MSKDMQTTVVASDYEQGELDHAEAMRHANDGFVHRKRGDKDDARQAFLKAWELERRVAMSLLDSDDLEPSRSILFRSAASLALLCDKHHDAQRLAYFGLAGSPPKRVRESLERILGKA